MKNHLALVGTGYTITVTPEAIELKKNLLAASAKIESVSDDLSADAARDECLEANIKKLSKRYESLIYSDQQAQERADKK